MFTPDSQFFLEVIVQGRPATEYPYRDERFIEGIVGREFTLRVGKSDPRRRALAVISVDGLSIMSGKPASAQDGGYIIERYKSSIDIPGWRLNDKAVAAFFFATLPETYATQMGKPTNIGVIGAKFWHEEVPLPMPFSEFPVPFPPSAAPRSATCSTTHNKKGSRTGRSTHTTSPWRGDRFWSPTRAHGHAC